MIGIFPSRPILNRQFLEAATSTIQNILRSGHLEYWKFIDNSLGHQTELSSKVNYTILELGAYLMSQIICSPLAYLFACSILLVCLCSSRIQSNLLIVSSICIFLVSLSDGALMPPLDSYNSRQKCAHFAETCWVAVFLAIIRKNIHRTLISESRLILRGRVFPGGQKGQCWRSSGKISWEQCFLGEGWWQGGIMAEAECYPRRDQADVVPAAGDNRPSWILQASTHSASLSTSSSSYLYFRLISRFALGSLGCLFPFHSKIAPYTRK